MPSLSIALIFAKDADGLARFYEASFGFAVTTREPGWIVFDAGGVGFAIHQIPLEHVKNIVIADPPRERSQGAIKLCFDVDDFAATKAKIEAAGGRLRDPNSWDGPNERDVIDPEGNVFRISQPNV
jgi:predicted enzyme related to lactoylglutathione lyase